MFEYYGGNIVICFRLDPKTHEKKSVAINRINYSIVLTQDSKNITCKSQSEEWMIESRTDVQYK